MKLNIVNTRKDINNPLYAAITVERQYRMMGQGFQNFENIEEHFTSKSLKDVMEYAMDTDRPIYIGLEGRTNKYRSGSRTITPKTLSKRESRLASWYTTL